MFPIFILIYDQKSTNEYIRICIRSQFDISNIFIFIFLAKLNVQHTITLKQTHFSRFIPAIYNSQIEAKIKLKLYFKQILIIGNLPA